MRNNNRFLFVCLFRKGIAKRMPLEYMVGTLSGYLECIRIKIDRSSTISIESEEMKQPTGHAKCALYGIASSSNNAFLLGAYFAGRVSIFEMHLYVTILV